MPSQTISIKADRPCRCSVGSEAQAEALGLGCRAEARLSRHMSISDNPFNKLVLHPSNIARTKPNKNLGNPTPIAISGFLIALSQQSCDLMGFRGTGGNIAAGTYVHTNPLQGDIQCSCRLR
jgi:hypothetical protein